MISGSTIERLSTSGADLAEKIGRLRAPAWKALTFPLMEGMIVPRKAVSVSIGRGSLWVISGSRFLSKIAVRDFRKYTFEEGKYPGPESLASTVSIALRELRAGSAGIILGIPGDWVIMRTAELPVTVKENITDVIAYELDRLTPLNSESAYYDFRVVGEDNGMLTIVIAAARADLIDQYLAALREQSIEVERVTVNILPDFADAEGIPDAQADEMIESLRDDARGFNLLGKGAHGKTKASMAVTLVLVILLLVALVPFVMLPLQKEERKLAEIDRQISLRKEEVMKVEGFRKEADVLMGEMAAIRSFKEIRPAALVILKELTGILPKSAWLTRMKMTETTVDIEGYAASASEILPKLEQSQYFRKVEFASPTVRDTRLNADRFVMKMEIEGFSKEGEEKAKDGKKK